MPQHCSAPCPRRLVRGQQHFRIKLERSRGVHCHIVRRESSFNGGSAPKEQTANFLIGISIRVIEDLIEHGP